MTMKVLVSWSTGKDSAWMLHRLQQRDDIELVGLVSTVNAQFERVAMHGVRTELVEAQATAAGLPWIPIDLPWPCSNADYEHIMARFIERAVEDGVTAMAFGDLFLEDVRAYRERMLEGTGITPLFPLWQQPTGALAREMIGGGLRATLTCIDPKKIDEKFAGQRFDAALLAALPAACDPCGEYGEFHSFAWDGPMFRQAVSVETGETVERDGFVFTDLLAATAGCQKQV